MEAQSFPISILAPTQMSELAKSRDAGVRNYSCRSINYSRQVSRRGDRDRSALQRMRISVGNVVVGDCAACRHICCGLATLQARRLTCYRHRIADVSGVCRAISGVGRRCSYQNEGRISRRNSNGRIIAPDIRWAVIAWSPCRTCRGIQAAPNLSLYRPRSRGAVLRRLNAHPASTAKMIVPQDTGTCAQ